MLRHATYAARRVAPRHAAAAHPHPVVPFREVTISANNLKVNNYLEHEGKLCQVKKTQHVKPGKVCCQPKVKI